MKLISLLSSAALVGLGVSFLDLSSNSRLALFAATASVMFVLGVVRDYAPRRPYWQPRPAPITRFPKKAARPALSLAA